MTDVNDRLLSSHAPGCSTISAAAYHADDSTPPALSSTLARVLLNQSPKHAWFQSPALNPDYVREDETRFDIGIAAHAFMLEGDTDFVLVDAPDWRGNATKAARELAVTTGKRPILLHQWEAVKRMVAAAREQLARFDDPPIPFVGGKAEQTLTWHEGETRCRARLDWLSDDHRHIADLKSTGGSAAPDAWARRIFADGYDVQAAFYLRGVKAVFGVEAAFRFVVVEVDAPHGLSVLGLSPGALALANRKVDRALEIWRECVATNVWPMFPTRTCYVDPPAWHETEWENREIREGTVYDL